MNQSTERVNGLKRLPKIRPETGENPLGRELKIVSVQVGDYAVLCARNPLSCTGRPDVTLRRGYEREIATMLWNRIVSPRGSMTELHGVVQDVRMVRTSLGKPLLYVSGERCGGISFSQTSGMLWAALAEDGLQVGIDAAEAVEFTGTYPYERVFGEPERRAWFHGARETYPDIAARVWSGKEAVVKAIGCGFHLVDPLEVGIVACANQGERITYRACFADRALQRFPALRSSTMHIAGFKERDAWVSIALMKGHIEGMCG